MKGPRHITLADAGSTVVIGMTGVTEVDLPSSGQWGVPVVSGGSVRLSIIATFAATGQQMWSVDPLTTGTSSVSIPSATGPAFTVTITVR